MPRCKKLWTATKNHSLPYLQGCCRLFPQTRTPNKSFVLCWWFVGIWPQQQGMPLITRTLSSDYVSVLKGEHQTFRVHWRRILLYCHLISYFNQTLGEFCDKYRLFEGVYSWTKSIPSILSPFLLAGEITVAYLRWVQAICPRLLKVERWSLSWSINELVLSDLSYRENCSLGVREEWKINCVQNIKFPARSIESLFKRNRS